MAHAVEPGYRLAGRYRLRRPAAGPASPTPVPGDPIWHALRVDGLAGASAPVLATTLPGVAYWRAHDDLLNRPVGIRVLAGDDPCADAVLDAARAAATLDDPRFLAVLDADRWEGLAYVVCEWVEAHDLTQLLAGGPLSDLEAQGLAAELARALAVAHGAGLPHGRLLPESVLVSDAGRLKIAGLGVAAAIHPGENVGGDPYADDVRGAGGILYAALTGRWPLAETWTATSLAPAPVAYGEPCTPRQVRAAVPPDLDDIACRALGIHVRRGSERLAGAAELADLLPPGSGGSESTGPLPVVPVEEVPALLAAPDRPHTARRTASVALACVLTGAVALLGYEVVAGLPDVVAPPARSPAQPSPSPSTGLEGLTPAGIDLPVRTVSAFDPQGDGSEHDDRAERAVDGDPSTTWTTQEYYNEPLGGLKDGVGLVLDLGAVRSVGAVTVDLVGHGSDLELRTARMSADTAPRRVRDFRRVAAADSASGTLTLNTERPVRARWLLVWFTSLPEVAPAQFRGGVAELSVRS